MSNYKITYIITIFIEIKEKLLIYFCISIQKNEKKKYRNNIFFFKWKRNILCCILNCDKINI